MSRLRDLLRLADLTLRMAWDRLRGRAVVLAHPNSVGQLQYLQPVFDDLRESGARATLYLALDYPPGEASPSPDIPLSRCFPARLAPRLGLAQVFLQPEIYGRGPAGAVKIFTGHGQPNKHTNWSEENLRAFDWYFLNGPLELDMFAEIMAAQPAATSHIRFFATGYPKLDALAQGRFDRAAVLRELGLDPRLPTVLYAPAWDPGGALRTLGLDLPRALLDIPGVNVLTKLHPANLEPPHSPYFAFYTGGKVWREEFAALRHKRFRYLDTLVVDPYLAAADVLVTDFSGVALEFMSQDRPVVYFHCPEFYAKTLPEWGSDPRLALEDDRFNAGRNAGIVVRSLEELPGAVALALQNPPEIAARRRELMQRFLYHPGHSARHTADAILAAARGEAPRDELTVPRPTPSFCQAGARRPETSRCEALTP